MYLILKSFNPFLQKFKLWGTQQRRAGLWTTHNFQSCFFHSVVFLGSLKYPDENGFDVFLKKHGGSENAATDCERTVFHFDIWQQYFKAALDR